MLPQELWALWTWNEKEDTTKHDERYSTIKSWAAVTKVRLESPLILKRLRLKLLILMSVFFGTGHHLIGQLPSPAIAMRKGTNMDMETNVNSCLTKWVVSFRVLLVELHRVRPLSSSPLPYAVFVPTLFEFDPIKSSSPLDWVISRWVDLWRRH